MYSFNNPFDTIVRKNSEEQLNSPKCFIADDIAHKKTGRKIENIGKVYDYVSQSHVLGFKQLLLGF